MKKILLILALALVCSFNANAQTNGEELSKVLTLKKATAEDAVAKEATKELELTEEAAKEVEFVEEKAYAEEAVAVKAEEKAVKISDSSEPCVTYTAEQALDATVEGNNNTFAAVYSTNATRNCGGKNVEKLPDFSDNVRPLLPSDEDVPLPRCDYMGQENCVYFVR